MRDQYITMIFLVHTPMNCRAYHRLKVENGNIKMVHYLWMKCATLLKYQRLRYRGLCAMILLLHRSHGEHRTARSFFRHVEKLGYGSLKWICALTALIRVSTKLNYTSKKLGNISL